MAPIRATSEDEPQGTAAPEGAPIINWPVAPDTIRLEPGQVHLWAAALNESVDQLSNLEALLSPAEQLRARAFKFLKDRSRFVIRRGLLRMTLGRYLERSPAAIEFRHGAHGKPEIQREEADNPLFFNTSHSGDIAVCAITSTCPIGVDVEHTVELSGIHSIARHFFLPREAQTLLALPADAQLPAFYACWTRKEAFLKATGEGIAESLAKVEVTLAPEDQPGVVSVAGDQRAREEWQLHPFVPAAGYLGCIAYRSAALGMQQWRVTKAIVGPATL
jgi:4'-phosphopantetheinyl transferase